jgi:hypothetical protein
VEQRAEAEDKVAAREEEEEEIEITQRYQLRTDKSYRRARQERSRRNYRRA